MTEGVVAELLTFRLGESECGVNILNVSEIRAYEQPTSISGVPDHLIGVVKWRGAIVPMIDLRRLLGLPAPYNAFTVVIVVVVTGRSYGLIVDGVSNVLDVDCALIRTCPEDVSEHARLMSGYVPVGVLGGSIPLFLPNIEAIVLAPEIRSIVA